jgi:hypothetical protein
MPLELQTLAYGEKMMICEDDSMEDGGKERIWEEEC